MPNSFPAAYYNRHILISGGGGYIGSALVQALLTIPCQITVLDRQPKPAWLPATSKATLRWQQGDVGERTTWQEVVGDVDTIFHLAAIEAPYSASSVERDCKVNAFSVVQLVEACRARSAQPHIILASSANIYGHAPHLPVNETTPDNPGRVWSAHKLLAEHYLRLLGEQASLPATILRLANVYGPTPAPSGDEHIIINKVLRAGLKGDTITLFANHNCVRDYLYLEDAVSAFLAAGKQPPSTYARYVIGSSEAVTIEQAWQLVAHIIKDTTGRKTTIATDSDRKLDQAEYRNFVADSSSFTAATGWHATTSLAAGLLATAKWIKLSYDQAFDVTRAKSKLEER